MKKTAIILSFCLMLHLFSAVLPLSVFATQDDSIILYEHSDGEQFAQDEKRLLTFSCTSNRYHLEMEYQTIVGKSVTPQISIVLDDAQAQVLDMPRLWVNQLEGGRFPKDEHDNEQIPTLQELTQWQTIRFFLADADGETEKGISLTEGIHQLELQMIRESVLVKRVRLVKETALPDYSIYQQEKFNQSVAIETDFSHVYEAELFKQKSHPEITISYDRSSPAITPNDAEAIRYNIIGGSGYSTPGQWISWTIEVPEDDWYAIDFTYRQSSNQGQISRRRLYVDGELLFAEAAQLEFPYCYGFETLTLSDKQGKAMPLYLAKGEHELKLMVVTGSLSGALQELSDVLQGLNRLYARITLITGESPDSFRDYDLDDNIDGLLESFAEYADTIERLSQTFTDNQENQNSNTAQMKQVSLLLRDFVSKPRKIATKLGDLRSQINTLASLLNSLRTQPLELDSLTVRSAQTVHATSNVNFWDVLLFRIHSFIHSFLEDYNAVTSTNGGDLLDVWVTTNSIDSFGFSTGREQSQIIMQLIRSGFYKETGTGVNLSLMDSGVLLQALVSGKEPDVAMFVPETILSNLYFRNALYDLKQMPDFNTIEKRFYPSAMIALRFNDKVFALPEVQMYNMMFYRTDILEDYQLKVPETWDEYYDVLAKLQKAGMQGGIGESQKMYETFLFQKGCSLYQEDLSATNLTTDASIQAFTEWTDLYVKYGVPVSFDQLNRFRSGQVPLVISSASFYSNLAVGAPEINNLWKMAPVPGVKTANGEINRCESSNVSGVAILNATDRADIACRFVEWWTRDEIQSSFALECEIRFGISARYFPANRSVIEKMSWNVEERKALTAQQEVVQGVQQSPASYFLIRNLSNAFRRVVYEYENPRDVIYRYAYETNNELQRKVKQLLLNEENVK